MDIVNVKIMYAENTPENLRYRVVIWTEPRILDIGFWWVHDTKKNNFRKIGKVGAKRTNNFDNAIEFCLRKGNK